MPVVGFASVSNDVYHDGEKVLPGEEAVVVTVVKDGNGKATVVRKSLTLADVTPPYNVDQVSVTASNDSITFHNLDAIEDDVAVISVGVYYSKSNNLNDSTFVDVTGKPNHIVTKLPESTTYYVWVIALDSVNTAGPLSLGSVTTLDRTAPDFVGFMAQSSTASKVLLVWDPSTDFGDNFPDIHISAYTSASSPTGPQVVNGEGTDFVSKAVVSDGYAVNSYEFGSGAEGALNHSTAYYFYAVAADASSNLSVVLSTSVSTSDLVPPSFGGLVVSDVSETAATVLWDTVIDNMDGSPDVYISAYNDSNDVHVTVAGGKFAFSQAVFLSGKTYRFLQSDGTNSSHPLIVSAASDRVSAQSSELTVRTGTPGTDGVSTWTAESAGTYYVHCYNHDNMGSVVNPVGVTDTPSAQAVINGTDAIANAAITDPAVNQFHFSNLFLGDTYHFYALASDASSNLSEILSDTTTTVDITAPLFANFAVGTPTETTVGLTWDAVTDNADGTPEVIIGAYSSASSPTAQQVLDRTGVGYISQVVVADGTGTTSYNYPGLAVHTTYHFYAFARDAAGNMSAVLTASATTPMSIQATSLVQGVSGYDVITKQDQMNVKLLNQDLKVSANNTSITAYLMLFKTNASVPTDAQNAYNLITGGATAVSVIVN